MGPQVVALVLDNSVIIGWFIPSQATAYTRRCKERAKREAVFVPALWEIEFSNVLLWLMKRKIITRHQALAGFHHAARLPLTVDREPVSLKMLFDLGDRHGISAYDAAYLELATRNGSPLGTRDERLARAARSTGILLN